MSAKHRRAKHCVIVAAALLPAMAFSASLADSTQPAAGGPLFAVIPTIGIGGPLAILALLFPSLFGGAFVLFRQWTAFLAVFSITSLLAFLHWWYADLFTRIGWASEPLLWLVLTLVTLLGVLWAWRRHLQLAQSEHQYIEAPARTEIAVLLLLSLCCAGMVVYYVLVPPQQLSILWMLTFALSIGIWTGTLVRLGRAIMSWFAGRETETNSLQPADDDPYLTSALDDSSTGEEVIHREPRRRLHLPTEGVMLWAMLVPSLLFLSWMAVPRGVTGEVIVSSEGIPAAEFVARKALDIPWHNNMGGVVFSSPAVDKDRCYVAAAHQSGGAQLGVLYCVHRRTGKIIWKFDDDGQMKQVFSSPRLVDGKLYIGEGFHFDPNCKLYCLAARTGKKLWHFQTTSQVEATPFVTGDKVYFGAGDDGVYAVKATTGELVWNYRKDSPLLRVGAGPLVHGERLWFGSGIDRSRPGDCETAVVCLEAKTGQEVWKVKTDLPNWATPVLAGQQLFVSLGNGDVLTDAPSPAGAILCLDPQTGRELWRFDVGNGVLSRPAVDARHVYFGSRDGFCYCVHRFDGKLRWKRNMGSPVVAAAILDQGHVSGRAVNVFIAASAGQVACLDAATGKVHWSNDELTAHSASLVSTPALLTTPTPRGTLRRIYFGSALYGFRLPGVWCFEDLLPAETE